MRAVGTRRVDDVSRSCRRVGVRLGERREVELLGLQLCTGIALALALIAFSAALAERVEQVGGLAEIRRRVGVRGDGALVDLAAARELGVGIRRRRGRLLRRFIDRRARRLGPGLLHRAALGVERARVEAARALGGVDRAQLRDQPLADIALLREVHGVGVDGGEHRLAVVERPHGAVADIVRRELEADHPAALLVPPGRPLARLRSEPGEALRDDGAETLVAVVVRLRAHRNRVRSLENVAALREHGLLVPLDIGVVQARLGGHLSARLSRADERLDLTRTRLPRLALAPRQMAQLAERGLVDDEAELVAGVVRDDQRPVISAHKAQFVHRRIPS